MLEELKLRYFKCFKSLDLPLSPLTLLAGANASGKSSILQWEASGGQNARGSQGRALVLVCK